MIFDAAHEPAATLRLRRVEREGFDDLGRGMKDGWFLGTRNLEGEANVTTRALARPYGHDAGKGRTKGLACWFNWIMN